MIYSTILATSVLALSALSNAAKIEKVGSLKVTSAAMLTIEDFDGDGTKDLLISTFTGNPLASGSFRVIKNIKVDDLENQKVDLVADKLTWPNEILGVPAEFTKYFGNGAFIPDGFLVSGKDTGAVRFVTPEGKVHTITTDKKGFFYHRVVLVDINGDGLPDVLTARATKPLFGSGYGEFLWLQNPGGLPSTQEVWQEHVLAHSTMKQLGFESPDVFFAVGDVNNDGKQDIAAAVFFQHGALEMLHLGDKGTSVNGTIIDNSIGAMFEVKYLDLNNDGRLDMLTTNHVNDKTISGVYAYELKVGADVSSAGSWVRHDIAKGFEVHEFGIGQAAPGGVWPMYVNGKDKKPSLVLSGDGSQEVYFLTPDSEDKNDWSYTTTIVENYKSTVGGCAVLSDDAFFCTDFDHGFINAYKVSA